MGFSFDTGFGDQDKLLQALGIGSAGFVNADVSRSAPPEQPKTATGNGTGQFVTGDWQGALFGGLQTALNYAIYRDQQKMTAVAAQPVVQAQAQAQTTNAGTMRLVLYGGIAAAILFMVTRK